MPEVRIVSTWVGGAGQRNQAWLNIALVERRERTRSQKQLEDAIRAAIAGIPGVEVSVGFNRPIYVALLGPDAQELARLTNEFADRLRAIPGVVDVESSVQPGVPAYAVRLKPGAVRELGLTVRRAETVTRTVTTDEGERVAVDHVVDAGR